MSKKQYKPGGVIGLFWGFFSNYQHLTLFVMCVDCVLCGGDGVGVCVYVCVCEGSISRQKAGVKGHSKGNLLRSPWKFPHSLALYPACGCFSRPAKFGG